MARLSTAATRVYRYTNTRRVAASYFPLYIPEISMPLEYALARVTSARARRSTRDVPKPIALGKRRFVAGAIIPAGHPHNFLPSFRVYNSFRYEEGRADTRASASGSIKGISMLVSLVSRER